MENTIVEITSRSEAIKAWDKKNVIIRDEDGYIYVYPLLGRGVSYHEFDLRRECNLMGFARLDSAKSWAECKGYNYVVWAGV